MRQMVTMWSTACWNSLCCLQHATYLLITVIKRSYKRDVVMSDLHTNMNQTYFFLQFSCIYSAHKFCWFLTFSTESLVEVMLAGELLKLDFSFKKIKKWSNKFSFSLFSRICCDQEYLEEEGEYREELINTMHARKTIWPGHTREKGKQYLWLRRHWVSTNHNVNSVIAIQFSK